MKMGDWFFFRRLKAGGRFLRVALVFLTNETSHAEPLTVTNIFITVYVCIYFIVVIQLSAFARTGTHDKNEVVSLCSNTITIAEEISLPQTHVEKFPSVILE